MSQVPVALFKYHTLSAYSLGALVNDTVWFAKPKSFNDPFDCALTLDKLKYKESVIHAISVAMERAKPEGLKQEHLTDIWPGDADAFHEYRNKIRGLFKDVGILCLSEVPDSMLMWSHYANHHRGFCVEYECAPESKLADAVCKVRYAEKIPSLSSVDFYGVNQEEAMSSLWLTKSECWSYEKEWRAMMLDGDRSYKMTSKIQTVIFGARMPEAERTMVSFALRHNGSVKFKQAVLSETDFVVELHDFVSSV